MRARSVYAWPPRRSPRAAGCSLTRVARGMKVGVPKETVAGERRVAIVPDVVSRLAPKGFEVLVERGAGAAASYPDAAFEAAGARLVDAVWAEADVVAKVQKP